MAQKLSESDAKTRKQLRALEYYYRAWPLDAIERFPWLIMALDAVFGDASQATQAVVEALGSLPGNEFGYDRLKLLLKLRGSVIHGGAPDVHESQNYQRNYEEYDNDPIFDLELITARDGKLLEHPHPRAHLIEANRRRSAAAL
jgi:hypothetical protein